MTVPQGPGGEHGSGGDDAAVERWCREVVERHTAPFTRPEFLKAVRALSARYVERRDELSHKSPLDSAGKRAAFAGFFAPLHFITARAILTALNASSVSIDRVIDLGCGTGVAGAAWALTHRTNPPVILGVDRNAWALNEAAWTWQTLQLSGRTRRASITAVLADLVPSQGRGRHSGSGLARTGIVLGWTVNELTRADRESVLPALIDAAARGAHVLVIEPIARRAAPWWDHWAAPIVAAGGRTDEWALPRLLPPSLADLDEAAGFQREQLTARTMAVRF